MISFSIGKHSPWGTYRLSISKRSGTTDGADFGFSALRAADGDGDGDGAQQHEVTKARRGANINAMRVNCRREKIDKHGILATV